MKFFSNKAFASIALLSLSLGVVAKDSSKIQARFGSTEVSLSGKSALEAVYTRSMHYLNNNVKEDAVSEMKATIDATGKAAYAPEAGDPRLQADVGVRLRYILGGEAKVKTDATEASVAGVDVAIPSTTLPYNLMWLRSASLKIALGSDKKLNDRYFQVGLFPFQVGRGIALGSAYEAGGFLAHGSRFSVDEFAPGFLLHTDFFYDDLELDAYFALLDNPHTSISKNTASIRTDDLSSDLHGETVRGTSKRKWAVAGSFHWKPLKEDDHNLDINPYVVYHYAPDQSIEFTADADSTMWTAGLAMDFEYDRFSYGFETAINHGQSTIKPWDRNEIELFNNDGVINSRYTKIYTADTSVPANVVAANQAVVTTANATAVAASNRGFAYNYENFSGALYNAPDRFRPEQKKNYGGWFFIADAAYECIKDRLTVAMDAGYVSGDLDRYDDVAAMSEEQRLNQKYAGFIPLQSIYSGKRVNHLVMLNEGVPRFAVDDPTKDLSSLYTSSKVIGTDTVVNTFTNLAYLGGAVEWKPAFAEDHELAIKPTVIHYWTPSAPNLANGNVASSSLGTAISIEAEAHAWKNLNLEGYFGVMLPGRQYEQLKADSVTIKGHALGNDIAFIVNLGMCYKF